MFKIIHNLTDDQLILRLNSGETLSIGPGSTSGQVLSVELKDNIMVKKLRDRRAIALYPVEGLILHSFILAFILAWHLLCSHVAPGNTILEPELGLDKFLTWPGQAGTMKEKGII